MTDATFWTRKWLGLKVRWTERLSPLSLSVPCRWLRRPTRIAGEKLCLLVIYAPDGMVSEHSLVQARAWKAQGFRVIVAAVCNALDSLAGGEQLSFCDGVMVRLNQGYDFGAWASAIVQLPELREAGLLAIANDSIYGPFAGFNRMLERVDACDADVIGAVESLQVRHHFQSFLIFFKGRALRSRTFWRFWRSVRTVEKRIVIYRYELKLRDRMAAGGLRCAALYPVTSDVGINPTIFQWRELIARGFPFLKVQLVRDNPLEEDIEDWPAILSGAGYDPRIVLDHLRLPQAA